MSISLQKGQKIDLTKTNPGISKVFAGLGWDTNKYDGGHAFDLDVSVFLLGIDGKAYDTKNSLVFYNNLNHESGAIEHLGDNLTGDGDGDDERININFSAVPAAVQKICFTVTIHEAEQRGQNFGQVSNAFIRIVDEISKQELIRYDLGEDFSIEKSVIVGELYRHDGEWKFNAIGNGFNGDLKALCINFGAELN